MNKEVFAFSDDGSITLTAYLHEPSAEMPIWRERPAVLVLPGGGYTVTSDREADPVALSFLAQGFHAFVLRYSVGPRATFPNPLCDASRALQHIREHADRWNVRANQIAVCGFSAGGHLAASLGTLWNDPEIMAAAGISEGENRPDALLLCYPVISAINHAQASCSQSRYLNRRVKISMRSSPVNCTWGRTPHRLFSSIPIRTIWYR